MIKIDGIAKRNLQEQVGYNSEQIDKIFELLDGLNVQDNLIKLTASSGTLTAEEMAVVSKDVAFIIYNNNLYIKTTTSATEYTFKQVALSATDQGTYNILQSFRIVITRANGAYLYSSNTVLSLYNKSEMDSLLGAKADSSALTSGLALKANIAGQAFTGEITAPSIIENMSGYSYDQSTKHADITPIYVGVVKNGNKVTAVFFMSLVATSSSYSGASFGNIHLPPELYDKVFPFSLSGINNLLDAKVIPAYYGYDTKIDTNLIMQKYGSNTTYLNLKPSVYATGLTVGTTYLMRYEVTFLLSDNLAS